MSNAQPPGPVKLKPTQGLDKGLQKKKSSAGKPIATYKPGVNYGKKP